MAEKHPIRNTVIGTLVSTAIIAVAGKVSGYLPIVWDTLVSALTWLWSIISYQVPLPVWLLIITGCLLLPTTVRVFIALFGSSEVPTYGREQYVEDTFGSVRCRWRYNTLSHEIDDIQMLCPGDQMELVAYGINTNEGRGLRCETCGKEYRVAGFSEQDTWNKLCRQIDRNLRTGDWKGIVAQYQKSDSFKASDSS